MRARDSVVVPGNHDGVHIGHRALLSRARAIADARGLDVTALTFDPHPSEFFASNESPNLLTTLPRRCELLREAGADDVFVQCFDATFASQSAEDFVQKTLREKLKSKAVVVGHDFRFGAHRRGDYNLLEKLAAESDVEVTQVDPVMLNGDIVSSSRIRTLVAEGRVKDASACLGRPYDIDSIVVTGEQRGRQIGFPTANLGDTRNIQLPKNGVYAATVTLIGHPLQPKRPLDHHKAVVNIGTRPTFGAGFSIEAHFLDFSGDLLGEAIRVAFIERIRDEVKFKNIDALTTQIRADIEYARRIL